MEFLDKLGDWFNAFLAGAERFITGLFGSSNERHIRQIGFKRDKQGNTVIVPGSVLDRINSLEPKYEKYTEDELKQCAPVFRERLARGETLDDILPDAFAAVREAGKRVLKMRHYDVQMVGGYILHKGMIAEMVTGEGKTLVATLPTYLNGLAGHVHVITVNDYLALRDMEWMGPLYMSLGLTVGAIQSNMSPQERQTHYACDITYGTNNEFGFDYLRDNMKPTKDLQVQGPLDFAVVDEIDNILIDEARTPLIISGPAHDDTTKYAKADKISRQLEQGVHFEVKEKEHTCHMTEAGVRKAEELAGVESFYTAGNMEWPHLIDNSLKAYHLYKRDVHYVVENGGVVIVDEFTGRKMEGRQWSDGLHQAVEAKEGVTIKNETQTLATITLQNYFKLYKKLAGMTGTAMTEAEEFWKIYKLDVVSVPTNQPMKRINFPDVIFRSEKEKWDAVVDEIREVHDTGRPILVGTVSIEKSELISNKLKKYGIDHKVLNAKFHEREAEFVAQAGRKKAVTIATNMAGRGTDIILGGNPEHMAWEELHREFESRLDVPKSVWDERTDHIAEREGMKQEGREVADLGGLHVIGTERHDSRRIDLQLRGRSGRQGDPGSSRFFLSLEDDLMRIFAGEWVKNMLTRLGMKEGEAIESGMVTRRVEAAQKKVEERHFDTRKHLLEYDEVMDEQRKNVYSYRQQILDGTDCRTLILDMIDQQVELGTHNILRDDYRWETIAAWVGQAFHIEIEPSQLRGMDQEQVQGYLLDEAQRQTEDIIVEQLETNLPADVEDEREWNWQALSRWANAQFDLNTNDRELKKIGRDNLFPYLNERAGQSRSRWDFADLDMLMADDFQRRSLSGWLYNQFLLEIDPQAFENLDTAAAITLIRERVRKAYNEKEIHFPVAVGVHRFLQDNSLSDRQRKEQLVKWASHRFKSQLSSEELGSQTSRDIVNLLTECSRNYNKYDPDSVSKRIEDQLRQAYQNGNSHEPNGQNGMENRAEKESLQQLANWANAEFHADLTAEDFDAVSQENARLKLLSEIQSIYRPELRQAEQSLILDVLDTAWKDHLYYMDHLRQGIGLMGYAQKDPKVEYKREGRRAFKQMWDRVAQQVTGAIFRIDQESPEFVGSLWQITGTVHEEAPTASEDPVQQLEPGQSDRAVDPIRNTAPKVGRNDPCPCGSGKKYKKCCGRGQ